MKFTELDYIEVVETARRDILEEDGCFDNIGERVNDLLMYTPGLGPYIRKKKHALMESSHLARDIVNGIK
jgi:hypothetical protein